MNTIAGFIRKSDVSLMYLMNKKLQCSFLDFVMKRITQMGDSIFATVLILVFLFNQNKSSVGKQLFIYLFISQIIIQGVKRIVNRPRPFMELEGIKLIDVPNCRYSFPSGHTSTAFSHAMILSLNFPAFSMLFLTMAGLVGISRIYLGVHYPTDVIIGGLIPLIGLKILTTFFVII